MARYAASASGMASVPGQAVNRHCAGSLTAVANAAAQIGSGAEKVVVGGGVQSLSMTPLMNWRIPGPSLEFEERWIPPTHVETPEAPGRDMSITVGWNTAQAVGISREEMDAWAFRSHQRAVGAIDSGAFVDEIVPLKIKGLDDALVESIVRQRLQDHDWNYGFIIDGFPRNVRQAMFFLESYDIDAVIILELPDEEVAARVLSRRICAGCGLDYNVIGRRPEESEICATCGGKLVMRLVDHVLKAPLTSSTDVAA